MHPGHLESADRAVESLALAAVFARAAEHLLARELEVVEVQLPRLPAEVTDLANRRAGQPRWKLVALFEDQELTDTLVAAVWIGRLLGARQHRDEIRAVGKRAPHLAAVQHPAIAVAGRLARDVGEIGARLRLRQRSRAEEFSTRHPRQIFAPLLRRETAAESVAARDYAGDAHPCAREFFGDQHVLERSQAKSAVRLRDHDSEVAHLRKLVPQRHRDIALLGI